MATLTIRDLDDDVKQRLRVRAAGFGRSMEEEARQILRAALEHSPEQGADWVRRLREPFVALEAWNWNCRLGSRCATRRIFPATTIRTRKGRSRR